MSLQVKRLELIDASVKKACQVIIYQRSIIFICKEFMWHLSSRRDEEAQTV